MAASPEQPGQGQQDLAQTAVFASRLSSMSWLVQEAGGPKAKCTCEHEMATLVSLPGLLAKVAMRLVPCIGTLP